MDGHSRRRPSPAMRVLGWLAVLMCAALVVSSLTAYGAYRKLASNIDHESGYDGANRPEKSEAVNILLLGSDTRSAEGTRNFGNVAGQRSDTIILFHMPPGHQKAQLVSFPRDSIVDIPSCKKPDGTMSEPIEGRINMAFNIGGPSCTWKAIESLTGLRIDHFVMVNFKGFINVIDALGGINVCLPVPVNDPTTNLDLAAGSHVLSGRQALGFVRVRHNIGNGSDLQRIQRQQEFLAGMVKKTTSKGLLLNPGKLFGFLNAVTASLTTDHGFGLRELQDLALSAKGIRPSDVTFTTVPVVPSGDGATVEWKQPAATELFDAIENDRKIPSKQSGSGRSSSSGSANTSGGSGASGSTPLPKPSMAPPGIQVTVLNGTTVPGLADSTAEKLEAAGFEVTDIGNADSQTYDESVVRYDVELEASANVLARATSVSETETDEELGRSVALVLGEDAQGMRVRPPIAIRQTGGSGGAQPGKGDGSGGTKKSSPIPKGMESINAGQNPCKTSSVE